MPPEEPEPLAMPAQDGLGAHDDQRTRPGAQAAGQEYEEPAIGGGQPGARGSAAMDDELVAQQRILQE